MHLNLGTRLCERRLVYLAVETGRNGLARSRDVDGNDRAGLGRIRRRVDREVFVENFKQSVLLCR